MSHLSDDSVVEFLQGNPGRARAERVEQHIDDCDECRRLVSEMARVMPTESFVREPGPAPEAGAADDGDTAEPVRPGDTIGRYIVLGKLGAGALGVVFVAFDPELDRQVALKLIKSRLWRRAPADAREMLRAEAVAMARLQHPNVVAVYDVGTYRDQLFVAMELIDGTNLATWLQRERRSWRERLAVVMEAGRGLAAAHRAGLVHRDVKPDNVLVAHDGRAVIADFGLALLGDGGEPSSRSAGGSGTPAYMAPEQREGQAGVGADQFSFCVTAWETIYGQRPFEGSTVAELDAAASAGRIRPPPRGPGVPAAVQRILARGLAADPARRHADVQTLLAALQRAAARRWRWWALGIAVVIALATAFAVTARRWPDPVDEQRRAGEQRLRSAWSQERREALTGALIARHPAHAGAPERLATRLDAYADGWLAMRLESARQARAGEQSPLVLERRLACLDRRLAQLDSLVRVLGEGDVALDRARAAIEELTPVTVCADTEALLAVVPPPEDATLAAEVAAVRQQIDRAEALRLGGDPAASLELAREAAAAASALDYLPVRAEARLALGLALDGSGQGHQANEELAAAIETAARARDDYLAARAWIARVGLLGARLGKHDEALLLAPAASAAVLRSGSPLELRAHLANDLGNTYYRAGTFDKALASYEEALALRRELLGPRHLLVAHTLSNLGSALSKFDRIDEAMQRATEALAIVEAELGPAHPSVAAILSNLGLRLHELGRAAEARPHLERALAIRRTTLGDDHPEVAGSRNNLALVLQDEGRFDEARVELEEAARIVRAKLGDDHPRLVTYLRNLGELEYQGGDLDAAERLFQDALARAERTLGPDHTSAGALQVWLGRVSLRHGLSRDALDRCEIALRNFGRALGETSSELAYPLLCLAEAELALGRDQRADELLTRAVEVSGRGRDELAKVAIGVGSTAAAARLRAR